MRYTIYKITNLVNSKFYIGKHQTIDPTDRYFGSGKALLNAIKIHGKHNFVKEILFDFDNEVEMNAKERELITENLIASPQSYNMAVGGEGGPHFKGKKHSKETRQRISEYSRNRRLSDESKKKITLAQTGKRVGCLNPHFGKSWINNGSETQLVTPDKLNDCVLQGWHKGRLIPKKSTKQS